MSWQFGAGEAGGIRAPLSKRMANLREHKYRDRRKQNQNNSKAQDETTAQYYDPYNLRLYELQL